MISYPKYKREINSVLKGNEVYSIGSKRNTFRDEANVLKHTDFTIVVDAFTDDEFDSILSKTLPKHEPIDPTVYELIKHLRKNLTKK